MKKIEIDHSSLHELVKFIVIGIFITTVSLLLMYIFYNVFYMGYWGSSAISYFVCSILSFILNKRITFKNNNSYMGTAPIFFINILVCYALAYLIAKPSIKYVLCIIRIEKTQIIEQTALFFGVCIFTVLNFIGQKYFVFNKESSDL